MADRAEPVEHSFLAWGVAGGYAVAYTLFLTGWLADLAKGGTRFSFFYFFQPPVFALISAVAIPSGLVMGLLACGVLRGLETRRASVRVVQLSAVGTAVVLFAGAAMSSFSVSWVDVYLVPPVAMVLVRCLMRRTVPGPQARVREG